MRVELLCQRLGDAGNPDIPGDMALEFAGGQPEIAKCARDQPAVMIAGQQKWRASGGITFVDRRNIRGSEEK